MSFKEEPRVIIYTSHGTLISNVMAGRGKNNILIEYHEEYFIF